MLNKEEISRYSRHLLLPEIGITGQEKLKNAKVLVIGAGGLILGAIITFLIVKMANKGKASSIITDAEAKGEVIIKEKNLLAKEKFLQLKAEHEKSINEKNVAILQAENRIKQKELTLSQKQEQTQRKDAELDTVRQNLAHQLDLLNAKQAEVDKFHRRQVEQLETLSGMKAEDAKAQLVESFR